MQTSATLHVSSTYTKLTHETTCFQYLKIPLQRFKIHNRPSDKAYIVNRTFRCKRFQRHVSSPGALYTKRDKSSINQACRYGIICWVKVKCSRYRPGVAQRVGGGIAILFHDRGTRRGWVVSSTLRPHFTPGKTRYPFYRRLGGLQGRFGRAENLVPTDYVFNTAVN